LAFGASAFLTRMLGPSGKGVQIFINTNVSLFTIILGLNINSFLLYFSAKEEQTKKRAIGFAISCLLGLFLLFGFTFWTLKTVESNILNFLIPDRYLEGIFPIYFLIFLFISMMGLIIQGYWKGSKLFAYVNFMVVFAAATKFVIYGIGYFLKLNDVVKMHLEQIFIMIILVMVITFLVKTILFYFKSDLKIDFAFRPDLYSFIGFMNLGYLTALLNFANKRIDLYFIEHFNTIEELGFYGLAAQLTNLVVTFALPATFVISPYLTSATKIRQEHLLGRFSRFIMTLGIGTLLMVFGVSWFFIPLVFGTDFVASIMPFQILSIGTFLLIFRNVFSIYNLSQKDLKPNLYAGILAFIATIILDFLWIPKYGIMGAAYASIIAYGLSCLFVFMSVYQKLDIALWDYLFINGNDINFLRKKIKPILRR